MAGQITISTLKDDAGVLATQNGMTGIAKAWVNFGYISSAISVAGSFNVSSVTRTGTGSYTINFTTAMPNSNYSITAMTSADAISARFCYVNGSNTALTTTSVPIQVVAAGGTGNDATFVGVMVMGS
jgi:hypothetical protein